jgi:hypothetical protein
MKLGESRPFGRNLCDASSGSAKHKVVRSKSGQKVWMAHGSTLKVDLGKEDNLPPHNFTTK